jgi:PQQ-like domain
MFIHRQLKTTLSLVLFILFIQNTFAQDWPQWRGANRDGAVKGFTAPKAWPDQLKQIWKAPVGVGHSSPLVIGARVYLHSRQAENEVVAAYDLNTGKTISPLLSGDLLFGMSHKNKGQFFCLDAASGETLWTGDPRQAENAAMVIAGDTIFSLTNDADLIVTSAADKGAKVTKRYHVAEKPTWAHPAIIGRDILIKDETTLAVWRLE